MVWSISRQRAMFCCSNLTIPSALIEDRMAKNRNDGDNNTPNRPGDSPAGASTTTGDFKGRRVTTCSFCGKTSREVGPMVEGPNEVYVCSNCTDLCQNIFRQERKRVTSVSTPFCACLRISVVYGHISTGTEQGERRFLVGSAQTA